MRRWIIALLLLVPGFASADEVTVDVCRYPDGVYQFSYTGDIASWSFENADSYDLDDLTASGVGVKFTVFFGGTSISIYGYPDVKLCPDESDAWQSGAPSILIPADGPGPYRIEIQDAYGHWSLVTDQAHPDGIVLYNHAGTVELIGSRGQDTNPAHYRLIEVNDGRE